MNALTYILVGISLAAAVTVVIHVIWLVGSWSRQLRHHQAEVEKAMTKLIPLGREVPNLEPTAEVEAQLASAQNVIDSVPLALYTRDEKLSQNVRETLARLRYIREALLPSSKPPSDDAANGLEG